jgi:4'-phosphopantetheinyl transferase
MPLEDGEIRVLKVDLGARDRDDDDPGVFPEWRILGEAERVRALRFVRPRDRRRFIICRGSLRLVLGQLVDDPPEAITLRFGPGGKPELAASRPPGVAPPLRFNVTHSGDLALIAVSLDRELGVDLERMRTISEAARIVESYFTSAEQAQFAALDEQARPAAFLRGWTRKEAILKARGVGLAGLATNYETMFGTTELIDRFSPATPLPRIGEWWLWEASPRADHFAALAVRDGSCPVPCCPPADSPPHDLSLHDTQGRT